MNRRHCLSMLPAIGAVPFPFSQAAKNKQDSGKAHHRIVPLSKSREDLHRIVEQSGTEVLSGDPDKPGAPFVIRLYNVENQVVVPHWHPEDEHLTLVKGRWYIAEGDVFDRSALHKLNVGDYVFMPKERRHFGWVEEASITQVHGIGPFKIIPADPWMFLSDPQAAPPFKFKVNDRVRSKRGEGVVKFGAFSEKNKVTQYGGKRRTAIYSLGGSRN